MKKINLKKISLSAIFLALGIVLPLFTAQIKEIGDTLLPMHIPVLLCGLICGPGYGLAVGFIMPLLRSVTFSVPPIYPNAVWMALELATYGFVVGILYFCRQNKRMGYLYFCLITAMISGRIVWGIAKTILLGLGGSEFTFEAFIAGGLIDSMPGIVLQLLLVPAVMRLLGRTGKI